MNQTIVGTCSCCKGPVTVPLAWWGIVPPTPTCQRCGAKAAENYGPEIQTVPVKNWTSIGTGPWDYDLAASPRLENYRPYLTPEQIKSWESGEWHNVGQQPGHS